MREILTMVMMTENIYGNDASNRAGKCLEFVDEVLKQCQMENYDNGR